MSLLLLETGSAVLVTLLFPIFLGVISKHGLTKWVLGWFTVGVLWLVAVTFVSLYVEVDLRVQSTRFMNQLFLRYAYYHHNYSEVELNPTTKDVVTARSAFVTLTKSVANTYAPFVISNVFSSLYILKHDPPSGVWFSLMYLWTLVFPAVALQLDPAPKREFALREKAVFLGAQLTLEQNPTRRSFGNSVSDGRYNCELETRYEQAAEAVTGQLYQQSALYLGGLALLSVGLLTALRRKSVVNSTRVTVLSMFTVNLQQIKWYVEEFGEFSKAANDLERCVPEDWALPRPERAAPPEEVQVAVAPALVQVVDLSYSTVGGGTVLQHLYLLASCGERVALSGPNGCGKSTLLNLLAHRLHPSAGYILLAGEVFADELEAAPRVGYYSQNQLGWGPWSVLQNLAFAQPDWSTPQLLERVQALGFGWLSSGFARGWDTPLRELSVGQRQAVALLQVFLKDAPIVLLDEPTSFMNSRFTAQLAKLLSSGTEFRSKLVMFVTHDVDFQRKVATRTVSLERSY